MSVSREGLHVLEHGETVVPLQRGGYIDARGLYFPCLSQRIIEACFPFSGGDVRVLGHLANWNQLVEARKKALVNHESELK